MFHFLAGFWGLEATGGTLRQAVASGNSELSATYGFGCRTSRGLRVSFAEVAADSHNGIALAWLLGFADELRIQEIAAFVVERHPPGPLLMLVKAGFGHRLFARAGIRCGGRRRATRRVGRMASTQGLVTERLLKVAPLARLPAWLYAFWHSDRWTRAALLDSTPASRDFIRFLTHIVSANGEAARGTAIAETVDRVIVHGGGAWEALLKQIGVRWWNSPAEARALVASGVSLAETQIGDAMANATWAYPERVQGVFKVGPDVKMSAAFHLAAAARSP
jgi:hypothetical protein